MGKIFFKIRYEYAGFVTDMRSGAECTPFQYSVVRNLG